MQQQMYYFTQINATNVGTDNAYRNTILNASIDIPSGLLAYLFAEYKKFFKSWLETRVWRSISEKNNIF